MLIFHRSEDTVIAELVDERFIISEVQHILDLLGDAGANDTNRIIIRKENLHPDFFRLHTGLAGEILQKISTYGFKLAIVGDFSKYTSKSLQDFIRESNRGNRVFFVDSREIGLLRLGSK
jgi:hypothetical protein